MFEQARVCKLMADRNGILVLNTESTPSVMAAATRLGKRIEKSTITAFYVTVKPKTPIDVSTLSGMGIRSLSPDEVAAVEEISKNWNGKVNLRSTKDQPTE